MEGWGRDNWGTVTPKARFSMAEANCMQAAETRASLEVSRVCRSGKLGQCPPGSWPVIGLFSGHI